MVQNNSHYIASADTIQSMSYIPNFNDPRVVRRCTQAIGFTNALVRTSKPVPIATRVIDKHFGHAGDNLSKYLRKELLICTDTHFNKDTGKCKKYVSSAEGIQLLLKNIGLKKAPAIDWGKKTYKEELETLDFKYNDKSHRLWNPIQNMRSEVRNKMLSDAGLIYHYDIVCCAPTLLHQYSEAVCPMIKVYIANRDQVRTDLANGLEVEQQIVKEFINSLFAGAVISTSPMRAVMNIFGQDRAKIEFIKQDTFINCLHTDIRKMWAPIIDRAPVEYITDKNNKQRKKAFNSRAKWNVYFTLERKVLNAQIDYMKERNIKSFLLHDGIFTDTKVDTKSMSKYIKDVTGFSVELE